MPKSPPSPREEGLIHGLASLGSRLRRAFSNDTVPPDPASPDDSASSLDLGNVLFLANGAISRAHHATNYRNTAERFQSDLNSARTQLERAIEQAVRPPTRGQDQSNLRLAQMTLARVHTALGNYEEANDLFGHVIDPHKPPADIDRSAWLQIFNIENAMEYMGDLLHTSNLDIPTMMCIDLTHDSAVDWTVDQKCSILLAKIWILIGKGQFEEARSWWRRLERLFPGTLEKTQYQIPFLVSCAVARAELDELDPARVDFVAALIASAVVYGIWHPKTLAILHEYGRILAKANRHQAARPLLLECCLGRCHRMGASHPLSMRTRAELEHCKNSQEDIQAVRVFSEMAVSNESHLSIAYEHIYLNTIVDLLVLAGETAFEEMEKTLQILLLDAQKHKFETTEHSAAIVLRIHMAISRCRFQQGRAAEAAEYIEGLDATVKRTTEGAFQSKLNLIIYHRASEDTKGKATTGSRQLFFDIETQLNRDQVRAYQRKLTELNQTHFNYTIGEDPIPVKAIENIGTGAYAIVESVEIFGRPYARKSIALPRYNQNRVRQTIQNEVSVIRSLSHRHIVQVHCTYEEKSRFAIILQPLASCDLEAFLAMPTETAISHSKLLWKWLRCLANTLAFIHSKGIRHKDIKTRNILVKDFEVIFADFGSSHAFLDEGTSVTEGPAFGHTLMYCAPEVVSWEKRSRSADIFSLGCVYAEMATSLDGRSVSDFYDFREAKTKSGGETHAYHATLDRVQEWFNKSKTTEARALYDEVIALMLDKEPKARPTAPSTSDTVQACFKGCTGEFLPTCAKCYPMQWDPVPDPD